MPSILQTRRISVEDVVITPRSVRSLAKILSDESNEPKKRNAHFRARFALSASGGFLFESDSSELFDEDGPLDNKQVFAIDMETTDYDSDSRIRIELQEGKTGYNNRIVVSGKDANWVAGVARRLEEEVSGFEKQPAWPRHWQTILTVVGAFGIGRIGQLLFDFALDHVFHVKPLSPRPAWAVSLDPYWFMIQWVDAFVVGFFPSAYITDKVIKLWPSIEFRMGPDHMRVLKKRRDRLSLFLTLILLPIVVSFLYDGIKYVFELR